MTYLILAVLLSSFIIISFKIMDKIGMEEQQVITLNYLFAASWGLVIWQDPLSVSYYVSKPWIWFSLLIGIFFIAGYTLIAKSSIKVGVAITAVSGKMSVLLPVLAGLFIFQDAFSWVKILGVVLSLLCFYLIFKKEGEIEINWKLIALPVLLFLVTGINDTLVKYVEHFHLDSDIHSFLIIVYLVALLIGAIQFGLNISIGKSKFKPINLIGGLFLGTMNFWSTWLFVRAMMEFEASVLFPVFNVSVVSLTALAGLFLFKEKLKPINWIGILLAIFAILMITAG